MCLSEFRRLMCQMWRTAVTEYKRTILQIISVWGEMILLAKSRKSVTVKWINFIYYFRNEFTFFRPRWRCPCVETKTPAARRKDQANVQNHRIDPHRLILCIYLLDWFVCFMCFHALSRDNITWSQRKKAMIFLSYHKLNSGKS